MTSKKEEERYATLASSSGKGESMFEDTRTKTTERVWGEYRSHAYLSTTNISNGLLCIFVLVPSFVLTGVLYSRCDPEEEEDFSADEASEMVL